MAILAQIRAHRLRFVKTIALYVSFIAVGMCTAIAGPTLLDLQMAVSTSYNMITYILPGRSGGFALGAFGGKLINDQLVYYLWILYDLIWLIALFTRIVGIFFSYINPQLLAVLCLTSGAAIMAYVPFNRTIYGLIVTFFANGLVMGMLDVGN